MAKVILYNEIDPDRRLFENLLLTPAERIKKLFDLMVLSAMFKKGPLKHPQGLGIVLKKKKQ